MSLKVITLLGTSCLLAGIASASAPASAVFPGGNGKIAVSRLVGDDPEIFTMNPDGSEATRLTDSPGEDSQPAWSADGTEIVFTSRRTGNAEVFVMNADGSSQTRLTTTPQPGESWEPAWSPDGTQIAFIRSNYTDADVYVMNADGTGLTNLTSFDVPGQDAAFPDWSPDGARILYQKAGFVYTPDICVMNADGTGKTNLTKSVDEEFRPTWSPDGTMIVFARQVADPVIHPPRLYLMNADGSNQRLISSNHAWRGQFSPEGSQILAEGTIIPDSVADAVYITNPDGTGTTTIGMPWDEIGDWQPLPGSGHPLPSVSPLPQTNSACTEVTAADVTPTPSRAATVTPAGLPNTGGFGDTSDWPNGWLIGALVAAAIAAAGMAIALVERWRVR